MSEFFLNKLTTKKKLVAWLMQLEEKYTTVLRNMLQNKDDKKEQNMIRVGCVYGEIEKNLKKKIKEKKENQEEKINRLQSYLYNEDPEKEFKYADVFGEFTPIYGLFSNSHSDKPAYVLLCKAIANRQIEILKKIRNYAIRHYAPALNEKIEDIKMPLQCKDISLHRIKLGKTTNSITTTSLLEQFEQAKDKDELANMLSDLSLIIDKYSHDL